MTMKCSLCGVVGLTEAEVHEAEEIVGKGWDTMCIPCAEAMARDNHDHALVYWRRIGQPAYPTTSVGSVEVVTPLQYEEIYGGTPRFGSHDGAWHVVSGEEEGIDNSLGLCDDLHNIHLICDALYISVAIHQHLGIAPPSRFEQSLWRKAELDGHDPEDADYYFHTTATLYGTGAETEARRQYNSEHSNTPEHNATPD